MKFNSVQEIREEVDRVFCLKNNPLLDDEMNAKGLNQSIHAWINYLTGEGPQPKKPERFDRELHHWSYGQAWLSGYVNVLQTKFFIEDQEGGHELTPKEFGDLYKKFKAGECEEMGEKVFIKWEPTEEFKKLIEQ